MGRDGSGTKRNERLHSDGEAKQTNKSSRWPPFLFPALHFRIMSAQPGPSESANASAPSLPQKRYFRQRAHVNVLADHALDYPRTPRQGNWAAELFPHFIQATPPPPPTASAAKKRASEGQGTESSANVKRPRVDNEVEGAGAPMDVDIQEPDSAPNTTEEFEGDGIEYFEEPTTEGTATDVKRIEFADIGCGYGGLLSTFTLAKKTTKNPPLSTQLPFLSSRTFSTLSGYSDAGHGNQNQGHGLCRRADQGPPSPGQRTRQNCL